MSASAPKNWPTTRVSLLAKLRDSSDNRSWQNFADRYGPVIYAYCRRRGIQHADAQNIVQEVLGRVSHSIGSFEYDRQRGQFRGWLGLITHQQMLKYQHRAARSQEILAEAAEHAVVDGQVGNADSEWVDVFNAHMYAVALSNIRCEYSVSDWEAFDRVWHRHQRPADVAEELNIETQRVYQVKFRIMQRLRSEIQRLSDDAAIIHRS